MVLLPLEFLVRFSITKFIVIFSLLLSSVSINAQILLRGIGNLVSEVPPPMNSPIEDNVYPRIWLVPDGYSEAPTVSDVMAEMGDGGSKETEFDTFLAFVNALYTNPPQDGDTAAALAFTAMTYGVTGANYAGHFANDYRDKARLIIMRLAQYGIIQPTFFTATTIPGGTLTIGHQYYVGYSYQNTALQSQGAEGYIQAYQNISGSPNLFTINSTNRTIRVPVVASADPQVDAIAIYAIDATDAENWHLVTVVANSNANVDISIENWAGGRANNTTGWSFDKTYNQVAAVDWLQAVNGLSAGDLEDILTQMKLVDNVDGAGTTSANVPINYWGNSFTPITRSVKTMSAVTMANNGTDNTWAQDVLNAFVAYWRDDSATTNYQNGMTWAASVYAGAEAGFGQGIDYGYGYTIIGQFAGEEAYRTGMGITRTAHYNVSAAGSITGVPRFTAYESIPDAFPRTINPSKPDNYNWIFAKTHKVYYSEIPNLQDYIQVRASLAAIGGAIQDFDSNSAELARWLMVHRTGTLSDMTTSINWITWGPWFFILDRNPDGAGMSPGDIGLPISQISTRGEASFKYNWDTSIDIPQVNFNAQLWSAGGGSMTTLGDFNIYRKGPAVLRQGVGVHDFTGNSYAGSMMVFPDRSIPYTDVSPASNKGATRGFFNPTNHLNIDYASGSQWDMTGETRSRLATLGGEDVNYVFRNLTKGYDYTIGGITVSDPQGPRLSEYVRQFVYFMPANPSNDSVRVVIFDRPTVLDTKFEMNWRMTLAGEPLTTDSGSWSAGPNRGPDGTARKMQSTNATFMSATNTLYGADNKLYWTPLLPTSRTMIRIQAPMTGGGFGMTFEDMYGVPYFDGQSWVNHEANAALWRVELVPATPALTNNILNVIEVGDSGDARSTTTTITGSGWTGARVGDRIAVFGSDGFNKISGTFTIPSGFNGKLFTGTLNPSTSRTLTPDANCNLNSGGLGVAYTANSGTSGSFYITAVATADCIVTVS